MNKKITGWILVIAGGIISSIGSTLVYGQKSKKKANDSEEEAD